MQSNVNIAKVLVVVTECSLLFATKPVMLQGPVYELTAVVQDTTTSKNYK